MVPKVSLVDYGIGNLWSVASAFRYLGAKVELISDPDQILNSEFIVLPGVGSFRKGMEALVQKGMDQALTEAVIGRGNKILGICLGMQLLGASSNENGQTAGLNLIPNRVGRFSKIDMGNLKIPHVGFNSVQFNETAGLFRDLNHSADFYFTHSYMMIREDGVSGRSGMGSYGVEFLAAFEYGNICGAQFHPEKSQTNGLILLHNFVTV